MTTKIDWCDDSINPFTGCTNGCKYCYARRMARRFAGKKGTVYSRLKKLKLDPFTPTLDWDKLNALKVKLLNARKRKRIFLGSMSDIGEMASWEALGESHYYGLNTVALQNEIHKFCLNLPRQTFLMLTKRPENMYLDTWPGNVHLGVSVTDTASAKKLVPVLRKLNVAIRWASVEPLLDDDFDPETLKGLDWVVIGAQSGSGAPVPLDNIAWRIRLWCLDNNVPCFVKHNMQKANPSYPWPTEMPGA